MPDWYSNARVRTASPGPRLTEGAGLFFAPELAPHVAHPRVERLGGEARDELLRRALIRYLHGTSVLEIRIVNEVAAEIAHGPRHWDVPARARVDALQIYCDEGYHAVLASDLLDQLGCDERQLPAPSFHASLGDLVERRAASREEASIVRFLFVVVSRPPSPRASRTSRRTGR